MRRSIYFVILGTLIAVGVFRTVQLSRGPGWPFSKQQTTKYTPASEAPLSASDVPRLAALDQEYARLVDAVLPSVVSITSQRVRQLGPSGISPFDLLLGNRSPRSQRAVETSLGSGVIVSREGHIMTNHHVVAQMSEIVVQLADDRAFRATLLGSDPNTDIAILKVDAPDLTPLPLGNSDEVRVGQLVFAIGNPFGLGETVTTGIVSAKGRRTEQDSAVEYLQTDAAVNRGNSGGPLINLRGEIVGINAAIYSNGQEGNWLGISFAVPANTARRALESVIKRGRIVRPYLGVVLQNLTPDLARSLGAKTTTGALVAGVLPDSPAARAGLQPGDIIASVSGHAVKTSGDLRIRLSQAEAGERLELKFARGGKESSATAEMGETPENIDAMLEQMQRGR